jgi:hypothetical protein
MPKKSEGYVYFAKLPIANMVKIGYSGSHPDARLRSFEIGCPLPLERAGVIRGDVFLEQRLHRRFAHLRVKKNREWFRLEADLIEFIEKHTLEWKPSTVRKKAKKPRKKSKYFVSEAESRRWMRGFSIGTVKPDFPHQFAYRGYTGVSDGVRVGGRVRGKIQTYPSVPFSAGSLEQLEEAFRKKVDFKWNYLENHRALRSL